MLQEIKKLEVNDNYTDGNLGNNRLDLLLNILGRPQDQSRTDRNTALHHAAASVAGTNPSASIQVIDILSKIMDAITTKTDTNSSDETDDENVEGRRRIESTKQTIAVHKNNNPMLRLGSIRNAHGDTPLMMAAAAAAAAAAVDMSDDDAQNCTTARSRTKENDDLTTSRKVTTSSTSSSFDFIRNWVREVVLREKECSDGDDAYGDNTDSGIWTMVRNILEASNKSGDTCLTLACSQGHKELVTYLLGMPTLYRPKLEPASSSMTKVEMKSDDVCYDCLQFPIKLQAEDVFRCRTSVHRMVKALNKLPREVQDQNERKKKRICSCLEVLEEQLRRQSDKATEQLLNEMADEDRNFVSAHDTTGSSKRKKKKTKQKKKKIDSKNTETRPGIGSEKTENVKIGSGDDSKDCCFDILVTRQEDGKTAVRAPGRDLRMDEAGTTSWDVFEANTNRSSESLDSLLRDRVKSISMKNSYDNNSHGMDVDSFMSALCITPKSLMLSEHGMALNLSPAQLDAVQAILEQQIDNVKNARIIQERRVKQK